MPALSINPRRVLLRPVRPCVPKPLKHRPVVRYANAMTIAAAYVASDGLVFCADSEHADDVSKYRKSKIFELKQRVIVTGAGSTHFIKAAADGLIEQLSIPPMDKKEARESTEEVIHELYEKHVYRFHEPTSHLCPAISMLVGVRCADGDLALIKTELGATAAVLVDGWDSAGTGKHIFEYWAGLLFDRQLDAEVASYLVLFMVREAKRNAPGCGGDTHVHVLHKDPSIPRKHSWTDENLILAGFPESVAQILVDAMDFPKVPDVTMLARLQEFTNTVRNLRMSVKLADQVRQRHLESTKGDQLPPQPSPE